MSWSSIAYAALCVILPVAWGLAVYWVSTQIERRVLRKKPRDGGEDAETLPLEYHI